MKLLEDSLYRLVHSLSAAEKIQFKKYAITQKQGDNAAYLTLFDAMLKQKKYDIETLRVKVGNTITNISDAKRYLYNALINFLVKNKQEDYYLVDILNLLHNEAHVLCQKGLFHESLSVLQEAKSMALKYEYFNKLLDLIDFELIHIRSFYKENYYQHREKAKHEKTLALKNIAVCDHYKNIFFNVNQYWEKKSAEENAIFINKLNELMQSEATVNVFTPSFPFFVKLYYSLSFSRYYNIINNIEKEYEQQNILFELWKEFPHMKEKYDGRYYEWICGYLNYRLVFKDFKGISLLLKEMSNSNSQKNTKREDLIFKHNYLSLQYLISIYAGNFADSYKYAIRKSKLSDLEKKPSHLHFVQKAESLMHLSVFSFISADYQKTNYYLEKVEELYLKFSKARMDIVSKLKIMKLLVRFAEGEIELFQNQYEANKIFFHRNKRENMGYTETILMNFFKEIIRTDVLEIRERLKELKNELIQKKLHRMIEYYIDFDFIAWIDSYITKIPMENIMREKAQKEYPEVLAVNF